MTAVLVLVVWGCYLAASASTVTVGDSGELITAAVGLGVPHPPGYPLFTWWTHLMTVLVPLGSLAFRAALGSVLAAALACAALARLVVEGWRASPWAGWGAGFLLAGSRLFGEAGVQVEVYALAALLWMWMGLAWRRWAETGAPRWGWSLAAWTGLAAAHHPLTLMAAPWVAWTLATRTPFTFRWGASVLLVLLLGAAGAAALPLRGLAHPLVMWGHPVDWDGVWSHLLRRQYGDVAAAPRTWSRWVEHLLEQGRSVGGQWRLPWGVAGVAAGAWWMIRNRAAGLAGLAVMASAGVAWILSHPSTAEWRTIVEVFYLPLVLLVVLGVGLALSRLANVGGVPRLRWVVLAGCLAAAELAWSHPARRLWSSRLGSAFGRNVLSAFPFQGTFLVSGDNQLFTVMYLQRVEGVRPDVRWVEESGALTGPVDAAMLDGLAAGGGLHVALWSGWEHRLFARPGARSCAHGLSYGFRPWSREVASGYWRRYDGVSLEDPSEEFTHRLVQLQHQYLSGVFQIERGEADLGRKILARAERLGGDNERFLYNLGTFYAKINWSSDAKRVYRQAVAVNGDYALPYINLGALYMEEGRWQEAYALFQEAIRAAPRRPDGYLNAGVALMKGGRTREAIDVWERGLGEAPDHPALKSYVARARELLGTAPGER